MTGTIRASVMRRDLEREKALGMSTSYSHAKEPRQRSSVAADEGPSVASTVFQLLSA